MVTEQEIKIWKPIPGYEGKYEASWGGMIRRVHKKSKPRVLSQYEKRRTRGSRKLFVKLSTDGKGKEIQVSQLVYKAFMGEIPEGCIVIHRNGSFMDNAVSNLKAVTKSECGARTGQKSRRRTVVKIDANEEDVEYYASAREAARENFMSYQTIIDRCNGLVKKSVAPDGFDYAWDDCEVSRKRTIERIRCVRGRSAKEI